MSRAPLVLALVAAVSSAPVRAQQPAPDPELVKGKEQVQARAYEAGIATLTAVVRRLQAAPRREAEVADAYLHLGIAYAALGQISPAKSQFVQALKRDSSLAPDPKTTPAAALEAFAAARQEGESEGVVSDGSHKKKRGAGKTILLVAGAAGVGVGAAAAAAGGGGGGGSSAPPPQPPVAISSSPYLQLIGVQPGPGSQLRPDSSVSVGIKAQNAGSTVLRVLLVAEGFTSAGRACLVGQSGPYSIAPGGSITSTFPMLSRCTAPFSTGVLLISMQDPVTGSRPYSASYGVGYQVTP